MAEETYTTIDNAPHAHPRDLDTPPNPGVSDIENARSRTSNLVNAITNNTLSDLTRRRDELDNTMERIRVSQRALTHYIDEFARFNHEALVLSKGIGEAIASAVKPFAADPPATITQTPKFNGDAHDA